MENAANLTVNKPANERAVGKAARRGPRWTTLVALLLVVLAVVQVGARGSLNWSWVPDTVSIAAIFTFAAALLWAAPEDRPLVTWGALVIAVSGILTLLPDFMGSDLTATVPNLTGMPYWLGITAALVLTVGVFLVSIAYGVIHSNRGWTIFWIGVLIGLSGIGLVTTHMADSVMPMDVLILSAIQVVPLAWGYMSATFLGISRWLSRGAALMLLFIAVEQAVLWLGLDAGANPDNVRFFVGLAHVIAWAALIYGALELRPATAPARPQESHSPAG